MNSFDLVVLTAANEAQANGYRAQLKGRPNVLVVADPGGRRIGSLGATVRVLRRLKQCKARDRVLICHSGGDAKRTPAYAALGKAFVPMPDGRPILDHIIETMEALDPAPGVTVCCGDVVPILNAKNVRFAPSGVTGVAYPDGPKIARAHGVYLASSTARRLVRVKGFLQKPKVSRGTYLIDTGILHFDWQTASKVAALNPQGDIYDEFPKMLLNGFAPFFVSLVPTCRFFHIGSSRELLAHLGRREKARRVLVDGVEAPVQRLGGDNIVTNVPRTFGPISLDRGECLTALPLKDGSWYFLRYQIDDTFKNDGLWEKHGLSEKMLNIDTTRLLALRSPASVRSARVTRPLRLDFAGGWSDTPPICYEVGGAVLNAAICLEGRESVVAAVERIDEDVVRVESVDLNRRGVLKAQAEIDGAIDPNDWCALIKSGLKVVGYQFQVDGGLCVRIRADVPKGSGLGTSSILGSALVEALLRVLRPDEVKKAGASLRDHVAHLTLELERVMATGGGWEDQMGALYPGVKLIETAKGRTQRFRLRRLSREAERRLASFLDERGVLYFTGQKRMARNILRGVIAFYRENAEGLAHAIVNGMKKDARAAFRALERGDMSAFAAALGRYWLDKKALDPGSTNPHVESIIARIAPWTEAVTLAGAGGGGFLFALARSRSAKAQILKALSAIGGSGRAYRFSLASAFDSHRC